MAVRTSVADSLSPTRRIVLFFTICIILYCACLTFNLPSAYLPLYNEAHNVTSSWTGVIIAASPLSIILACLFSAFVLNRFSNRALFLVPTVTLGILTALNAVLDCMPDSKYYVALSSVFRFGQGIAGGLIEVTAFAAMVGVFPHKVATATAIGEMMLNGALASGPFIGSVFYAIGGYKLAFIVPGAIILLCVIPECFIPQLTTNIKVDNRKALYVLTDPMILFAAWHCAACQILQNYHMPLLSVYVEKMLGEDVVWTGVALLINSGFICISAPIIGCLVDRFNPYVFFVASSIFLPIVYIFIGPIPLITFIGPSKIQLLATLAAMGILVPMGCIPSLLVMFDLYKAKHGGELHPWAANVLVSLYCASYPVGVFLGVVTSGIVAEYVSFRWSTGVMAAVFVFQSLDCIAFCCAVYKKKQRRVGSEVYSNY